MKAQQLTGNIENGWDRRSSNFGSPYRAFVSVDNNALRNSLLSILPEC